MYPGEFEKFFSRVSNQFTLDLLARERQFEGKSLHRNPETPIWDTIDILDTCEVVDLGGGKYVQTASFFKRPVRILFFIQLSEFESRLFRIHEKMGTDVALLNDKNLKELVVEFLEREVGEWQQEYDTKGKLKEDLKAISVFRNSVMHVNKRLEKTIAPETLIKRKQQLGKLLSALQQILDKMYQDTSEEKNELSEVQMQEMLRSIGSLQESIEVIYTLRPSRRLVGEDSIMTRGWEMVLLMCTRSRRRILIRKGVEK
ncbi:hypothetical protein CMI48_01425 [Candidatus Pacearchaeota archaeon]|jgi:hypothetical protein|nr:hypothetical protein [Candidatus Pacearchaeota archaeon]|tara:strand:+ start:99 stop:872 length:774 start_codon:yes stop_codon:yes gene_type:complete